ncbi:hypothetical protein BDB01DRAFT_794052 [Pilobolus umbonatus]|nr:hypothetical protein BDB01DRAFT_794052 [Pilobolus umbonatus]
MTLSEACIKIEEQESMWDYSIDRSLFLSPTVYIPLPYYATTSSGSTGESGNSSHSVCPMESSLYSDILSLNYDNNIDHVYYMSDSDDTSPTSTHMYSASSIYHHRLLQDNQPIRYIQPEDMTLQWPSTRLDEDTKHNNRLEGVRNELDSLKLSQEDDREDGREDGSDYTVYIADTNKKRGYRTDNEDYREKVTETTRKRRYTNKRTVTSYDAETTLYLKSVFFEVI